MFFSPFNLVLVFGLGPWTPLTLIFPTDKSRPFMGPVPSIGGVVKNGQKYISPNEIQFILFVYAFNKRNCPSCDKKINLKANVLQ